MKILMSAMIGSETTVELESSFLKSASYNHHNRSLKVSMISGSGEERVYEYGSVSSRTFTDLSEADSAGRFFNANIRSLPERRV